MQFIFFPYFTPTKTPRLVSAFSCKTTEWDDEADHVGLTLDSQLIFRRFRLLKHRPIDGFGGYGYFMTNYTLKKATIVGDTEADDALKFVLHRYAEKKPLSLTAIE